VRSDTYVHAPRGGGGETLERLRRDLERREVPSDVRLYEEGTPARAVAEAAADLDVPAQDPADGLLATAAHVDMLVMGSRSEATATLPAGAETRGAV
jgi:nucleotide-binding universal stress UspA family protein